MTADDPLATMQTSTALPATMSFDLEGTPVTQTGAFVTAVLRRRSDGWRITAWAWTKGQQQ